MIQCKQQIAILMATYNGGKYLREQIDSILSQTFTDWHLYIHDDGSKDDTVSVISEYVNRHPERITLLDYPSQGGACENFFSLLESVEARYYMFSDQDDVWYNDKIEVTLQRMLDIESRNKQGIAAIVHTDLCLVSSDLAVEDESFVRNQHIKVECVKTFADYAYTNTVTGCTMLFNPAAKASIKYPRHAARMHDSWITLSVAAKGGIVDFIDKPTIYYRQHGNNTLGAKDMNAMTLSYKLRNAVNMIDDIYGHYREMNAVKPISLVAFLMARFRYKNK